MTLKQIDGMIGALRGLPLDQEARLSRGHILWLLQVAENVHRLRDLTDAHSAGAINDATYWTRSQVINLDLNELFRPHREKQAQPQQQSLLENLP